MAGRGAPPPKDKRKAERGNKQPQVRPRAQGSPHEGEPRPDPETRRRHGLVGSESGSGSPPDHEEQARPRDTGRKGA
jgi:hypothetical protein